jgi:hypothetical protein
MAREGSGRETPTALFDTDGFRMICQTTGRTIMFNQVGFPIINRHPRPDPVPMFVCYPREPLQSVPSAATCAGIFKKTKQNRSLR